MTQSIIFLFISLLLAGVEPFLPFGSLVIAWASVVGVKKSGWVAIVVVIIMGFVRDIVLVKTLGISNVFLLSAWMCARIAAARFRHPFFITMFVSILGSVVLSLFEQQPILPGVFFGLCSAVAFLWAWERCSQSNGIVLRHL